MKKQEMMRILNKFKKFIGLSDYEIIINPKISDTQEFYAEADVNLYKQKITITLTTRFEKTSDKDKRETLIHELVHSRITVFQKKLDHLTEDEEEFLANDLTRAIIKLR